jgi:hypothetical protein
MREVYMNCGSAWDMDWVLRLGYIYKCCSYVCILLMDWQHGVFGVRQRVFSPFNEHIHDFKIFLFCASDAFIFTDGRVTDLLTLSILWSYFYLQLPKKQPHISILQYFPHTFPLLS